MKSVKEALDSMTEEGWLEIAKKATEEQNRKLDEWKSAVGEEEPEKQDQDTI